MSDDPKRLYHSELVTLTNEGPIQCDSLTGPKDSRFQKDWPGKQWAAVFLNGRERQLILENELCARALDGTSGKRIELLALPKDDANGYPEELKIEIVGPAQNSGSRGGNGSGGGQQRQQPRPDNSNQQQRRNDPPQERQQQPPAQQPQATGGDPTKQVKGYLHKRAEAWEIAFECAVAAICRRHAAATGQPVDQQFAESVRAEMLQHAIQSLPTTLTISVDRIWSGQPMFPAVGELPVDATADLRAYGIQSQG